MRNGEMLSKALSGIDEDMLVETEKLFLDKLPSETQGREYEKTASDTNYNDKIRSITRYRRYSAAVASFAAVACILILLFVRGKQDRIPEVLIYGEAIDKSGVVVETGSTPAAAAYTAERSSQSEQIYEIPLHITTGSEAYVSVNTGTIMPSGDTRTTLKAEADLTWCLLPSEGAMLNVEADGRTVSVVLHYNEETGQWMLFMNE